MGELDFIVHAIGYADKEDLKAATSRPAAPLPSGARHLRLFLHRRGATRRTADEEWRQHADLSYLGAER